MGVLDILINKNKEPKVNREYIYLHDLSWTEEWEELLSNGLQYGSIVIDVIKLENDSFVFTEKETGRKFRTNYGWALAENTEENRKSIQEYEFLKKEKDKLTIRLKKSRDRIIDLDGPTKI